LVSRHAFDSRRLHHFMDDRWNELRRIAGSIPVSLTCLYCRQPIPMASFSEHKAACEPLWRQKLHVDRERRDWLILKISQ